MTGMAFSGIPALDEAWDGCLEFDCGTKAPEPQASPLQDGEEDLDLVDPGGVKRCVDELELPSMACVAKNFSGTLRRVPVRKELLG